MSSGLGLRLWARNPEKYRKQRRLPPGRDGNPSRLRRTSPDHHRNATRRWKSPRASRIRPGPCRTKGSRDRRSHRNATRRRRSPRASRIHPGPCRTRGSRDRRSHRAATRRRKSPRASRIRPGPCRTTRRKIPGERRNNRKPNRLQGRSRHRLKKSRSQSRQVHKKRKGNGSSGGLPKRIPLQIRNAMVSATILSIALNERSWIGDWEMDAGIGLPGRPAWAMIVQRELVLEAPDNPHPVRRKADELWSAACWGVSFGNSPK